MHVNPTTASKWCTISSQPNIEMVLKMMEVLDVNIDDILNIPKRREPSTESTSIIHITHDQWDNYFTVDT